MSLRFVPPPQKHFTPQQTLHPPTNTSSPNKHFSNFLKLNTTQTPPSYRPSRHEAGNPFLPSKEGNTTWNVLLQVRVIIFQHQVSGKHFKHAPIKCRERWTNFQLHGKHPLCMSNLDQVRRAYLMGLGSLTSPWDAWSSYFPTHGPIQYFPKCRVFLPNNKVMPSVGKV
jgi:hypothetical protein